jgi:hypothetical protein
MFLQNVFSSMATRRRRLARQNREKTSVPLPKRWQELLDVTRHKQIQSYPISNASEPRGLHEKDGSTASSSPRPSRAFRDGWGL